jgi:hypothetical protein
MPPIFTTSKIREEASGKGRRYYRNNKKKNFAFKVQQWIQVVHGDLLALRLQFADIQSIIIQVLQPELYKTNFYSSYSSFLS